MDTCGSHRRDQITGEIATGIVLFVLMLVLGAAAMWLTDALGSGLEDDVARIAGLAIFALALVVSIRYVYRHRKP